MKYFQYILFFLSCLWGNLSSAFGNEYLLNFVPDAQHPIENIKWNNEKKNINPQIEIRSNPRPNQSRYYVTLQGNYQGKSNRVLLEAEPINLNDKGEFKVEVDIHGEKNEFRITEINLRGITIVEKDLLLFPNWKEFLHPVSARKWWIEGGLAPAYVNYFQTDINPLAEFALKIQGSGGIFFYKGLFAEADAGYTFPLSPFVTNSSDNIQLLSVDVLAGYRILMRSEWELRLRAGYRYATCFSNTAFCFQNLVAPEIVPSIKRYFKNNHSVWIQLRYAPIMEGISLLGVNNAEYGFRLGYSIPVKIARKILPITVGLDGRWLDLNITGGGTLKMRQVAIELNYVY